MRLTAVLSLTMVLAGSAVAQAPLPPEFEGGEKLAAILHRVSRAQLETTTLEAAFEQRRVSRLLAEPSVMNGRFCFRAPDHVRWQYTSPHPRRAAGAADHDRARAQRDRRRHPPGRRDRARVPHRAGGRKN